MQIRLDPDIARTVKRNADAHRRIFKRRKSCAAIVNEALREALGAGAAKMITEEFDPKLWTRLPTT